MTDAELIARLRDEHVSASRTEAADRIEALIAERDGLVAIIAKTGDGIRLLARAEAAEAKLAKAVKPLEWVDFEGRGAKAQAWNESSYMIQNWHEGRWEISASYPGYSTSIYGIERFHPTLETAKAAAQADYEARILSALDMYPTVSPDVAALVEALENVIGEYDLFRKYEYERGLAPLDDEIREARAALARVKGVV